MSEKCRVCASIAAFCDPNIEVAEGVWDGEHTCGLSAEVPVEATIESPVEQTDEIVMYVVVRTDLQMSPGKQGAQIGHAVHLGLKGPLDNAEHGRWEDDWNRHSYPKIMLRAGSEKDLRKLHGRLLEGGYHAALVIDEGRTELTPGSVTAVGMMPMPRSIARQFVKRFQKL